MKILQLNKLYYPHIGGIEEAVQALSEGLVKNGHEVKVIAASESWPGGSKRLNEVLIRTTGSITTLQSVPIAPMFPWHQQREASKADIIHSHLPNPLCTISAMLTPRSEAANVVTYHSDIVRQKRALQVYQPLLNRYLSSVDRIIVTSPRLLEHSDILSPYEDKCRVVPLSVDLANVDTDPPDANLPTDERPTILFLGRLSYYKGIKYLIDAMEEIDATLLIAGDGKQADDLQARVRDHGLNESIHFLGYVPDNKLDACYEAADVFVLPSVEPSEAFGIVQLEAMAHSLPVVNTSLSTGVPWVSKDGETGITVPPRDSAALAGAIRELLDDLEKRESYGETARERVERKFTRDRMISNVLDVYGELM